MTGDGENGDRRTLRAHRVTAPSAMSQAPGRRDILMGLGAVPLVGASVLGSSGLAAAATGAIVAPPLRIPVGFCVGAGLRIPSLQRLDAVKAAGFDYIELWTTELMGFSPAEFQAYQARVQSLGVPTPVANFFLPGDITVVGPATNPAKEMDYVRRALDRLGQLDVKTVVWGSAGSREPPAGFSHERAFAQCVESCRRLAAEAQARGMLVVVEPVSRAEAKIRANEPGFLHTAGSALRLVEAVGHPSLQLMVDFYHLAVEGEDPGVILRAGASIRHLHIANPQGRVFPKVVTEYAYSPFFNNLRKIGYRDRISVEAASMDVAADGPAAIALIRNAFAS